MSSFIKFVVSMFVSVESSVSADAAPPARVTDNPSIETQETESKVVEAPSRFVSGLGQVGGGLLGGAILVVTPIYLLDTYYKGDGDLAAPMLGLGILGGVVGTTLGGGRSVNGSGGMDPYWRRWLGPSVVLVYPLLWARG